MVPRWIHSGRINKRRPRGFLGTSSGAGPWTPSDLGSDLLRDWDASLGVSHTANAINAWEDQVTGQVLAQGSGGAQPIWNGSDQIDFNGTTHYLFDTNPFMYANGEICIFWVGGSVGTISAGQFLMEGRSTNANPAYFAAEADTGGDLDQISCFLRNDAGTALLSHPNISAAGVLDDTEKILCWQDTGSVYDSYVDGVVGTQQAYTRSGTVTLDRVAIGANLRTTVANYNDCFVRRLLVTNVLSTDDRQKMEGFLAHNYTNNLQVGHPYYSEAPTV